MNYTIMDGPTQCLIKQCYKKIHRNISIKAQRETDFFFLLTVL